ncbi:M16 family metallopeptidase [Alistipes sp.]|uniref:M16 family metallopeptidase n=1 Tax=Alistipes sp. TaxID=1872444 RepID=UPI003AEFF0F3
MNSEFSTYVLPNGIRGVHRQVKGSVAHCALVIGAGSRDEHPDEYGLAHFTEHAFFKGTARRRAWQVNCRLENLGGELNAFTTKEDTTIHATTLRGDFRKAAELIADIAFRSTFPERELEREKEVIVDEINTYKDSPSEMIYDTFEDLLFAGSELGHNILGRKAALMRYDGRAIRSFISRTHTTDQMVFSSIGNFSARTAEAVAMRCFADHPASARGYERVAPGPGARFDKTVSRHTHQTHCILGGRACGIQDERRLPLALVTNILGGPCANSLLNVEVREKHGLTYNIEASYTPYAETGIVTIYFSSDHGHAEECISLIEAQLDRLRTAPLSARRLSMAKKQFIAQLAISGESNESYMLGAGKSLVTHDGMDTMQEVYAKVRSLTASDLMEVAAETFSDLSRLIYK